MKTLIFSLFIIFVWTYVYYTNNFDLYRVSFQSFITKGVIYLDFKYSKQVKDSKYFTKIEEVRNTKLNICARLCLRLKYTEVIVFSEYRV